VIADQLASLHATAYRPHAADAEAKKSIDDNYSIIRRMRESTFDRSLTDAIHYLQRHYAPMFVNLDKRIHQLYTSFDNDVNYAYRPLIVNTDPTVLCHGHMTADDLHFDDDNGRLVLISNWDVSV
jgi:hypothetical protein